MEFQKAQHSVTVLSYYGYLFRITRLVSIKKKVYELKFISIIVKFNFKML